MNTNRTLALFVTRLAIFTGALAGALVVAGTSARAAPPAAPEPPRHGPLPTAPRTFRNPVLPGFYPDPSVIRVGDDYYLVTSTFEYFPGIPIFRSRDLVGWEQIGHVLDRPSQLELGGIAASDGIYASTIRHHRGTFYVVTTLVNRNPRDKFTNFVVTAKSPAGPWSDPIILSESHYRIDPSLFFDDDGRAWFTANRNLTPEPFDHHRIITLQELDLRTMKLVGERYDLTEGHGRTAYAPEGPHIYKKDGFYYLLHAEGGTFEGHSVAISRSKKITGPYDLYQHNPIFTHRHLGPGQEIHSVGHGDLVQTQKGEWWMVALGMRGVPGHCCNLGRETFLLPVSWEKGQWPVVVPGHGRVRAVERAPNLPPFDARTPAATDHFEGKTLGQVWNFVRTPKGDFWSLASRPGHLALRAKKETLAEDGNPAFVGRRVQHADFTVRAKMEFQPGAEGESAGLVIRNGNHHLRFVKGRRGGAEVLRVISREQGKERTLAEARVPAGALHLKVSCRRETDYTFAYATEPETWVAVGGRADARHLNDKAPGGAFTGAYVGMYATASGAESQRQASFDFFEYKPEE